MQLAKRFDFHFYGVYVRFERKKNIPGNTSKRNNAIAGVKAKISTRFNTFKSFETLRSEKHIVFSTSLTSQR